MRTIIGVERINEYERLFRGRRIGLITNFTGISPDWSRDTVELFQGKNGLYRVHRKRRTRYRPFFPWSDRANRRF